MAPPGLQVISSTRPTLGGFSVVAPRNLVIGFGDSNMEGRSASDQTDHSLVAAFPAVQMTFRHAPALPAVWTDYTGDLQPHNVLGSPCMGIELSMCRELLWNGLPDLAYGKTAIPGTTATHWNSTLKADLLDFIADMETSSGESLGAVVISLGTNDAGAADTAAAFQTQIAEIVASIRAQFGAAVKVVLVKTPSTAAVTNLATVRAGAVAYVASDAQSVLIDTDDLTLYDGLHFYAESYAALGQRAAFEVLDLLAVDRAVVATAYPQVVGWGPAVGGAGTLSPRSWTGNIDGDREFLVLSTGHPDVTASLATAQGFTAIASADQSSNWASTFWRRCKVYTRVVAQATLDASGGYMPPPLVADTGDLLGAKIFTVRGPSGTPTIGAVGGGVNNGYTTTPVTVTSPTTTVDNSLVLYFAAGFTGFSTNSMAITNAGLVNVTEHQDSRLHIGSDYALINLTSGVKAALGAVASATITPPSNMVIAAVSIAVAP